MSSPCSFPNHHVVPVATVYAAINGSQIDVDSIPPSHSHTAPSPCGFQSLCPKLTRTSSRRARARAQHLGRTSSAHSQARLRALLGVARS
ncbi:hypothetical protein M0R45_036145 [Rubus argutus]|uniref:Uncharacterized protein n=1 Tax=Rubus argutus TaxID=59490 RepID=A0AAW1VX02_RUBAR